MASRSKPHLAALPRAELCAYWLLSFSSHLYSFYELHRFSQEHEAGLERDLQLETGFLFGGSKKDPADFEWSFWSDWARRSLLWTLLGHAAVSRSAAVLVPRYRVAAVCAYGILAACGTLGIRGVGVVTLHLALSLAVAQLRKPAASWVCGLLLLSTLHLHPLQDLKRGWYESDEQYLLLLFALAVGGLRFLSFSLEQCWRPLEAGGLTQLYWLAAYSFYHPTFYNGPILTFRDFVQQMRRPAERGASGGVRTLAQAARMLAWWLMAEAMIHLMYLHAIQANQTYLETLPPWALGGLALALVQFFYVKYLVLFGVPSLLARLDGLVPPPLPRCVSTMTSFTEMWRRFDEGLYQWLIRYIYVPLGGAQRGPVRKAVSTGLAFGFVCLWHGGHDYLRIWALINWAMVLLEAGAGTLLSSSAVRPKIERCLAPPMRRRGLALLSAASTAMLILSNLVFLGGTHVGWVFWNRVVVHGWFTMGPPMLFFLYCFAQIGLEWNHSAT